MINVLLSRLVLTFYRHLNNLSTIRLHKVHIKPVLCITIYTNIARENIQYKQK